MAQDERSRWGFDHTATEDNTLPTHSRGCHAASLETSPFSSTNSVPESTSQIMQCQPWPRACCNLNMVSSLFLLSGRLLHPRGPSEPTGFCGRMPQGRVHKDTTVWGTVVGLAEQDPRLILLSKEERRSFLWRPQHTAQPWSGVALLRHSSPLSGEEGGAGRTLVVAGKH